MSWLLFTDKLDEVIPEEYTFGHIWVGVFPEFQMKGKRLSLNVSGTIAWAGD